LIDGAVQPGDRALVVDDVLTSGGSLLKVIAAARDIGIEVSHALVLVDREEHNGRARIEQEHVRLVSLLTIQDLMKARKQI
jgi:orotate phosphoribosyltransferase